MTARIPETPRKGSIHTDASHGCQGVRVLKTVETRILGFGSGWE